MALRRLAVVLLLFVAVPAIADEVDPRFPSPAVEPVEVIELEVVFAQLRSPARDGAEAKPIETGPFDLTALEKAGQVVATERVKLTTVTGHAAFAQFGRSQPHVTGVAPQPRAGGFAVGARQVQFQQFGTLVTLTPTLRDDRIVVEVVAERSIPSLAEGPLLGKDADGEEIRSSGIDTMTVRTVVAVADGKSVIVGGSAQQGADDASATWVILTARRVK